MAGVTYDLRWTCTITDTDADSEEIPRKIVIDKSITAAETTGAKRWTFQNTTKTLWDSAAASEPATTFQFLAIWSDNTVDLEFTVADGDGSENRFVLRTGGGHPPICLASNYSTKREAGDDAFAGTASTIQKVRAKELNNVETTVWLLVIKP